MSEAAAILVELRRIADALEHRAAMPGEAWRGRLWLSMVRPCFAELPEAKRGKFDQRRWVSRRFESD